MEFINSANLIYAERGIFRKNTKLFLEMSRLDSKNNMVQLLSKKQAVIPLKWGFIDCQVS